jgi:hypothetical protein
MGMHRIQFQEGMSLFEFFQHWGDEAQCEAAVEQARWPAGFRCPCCGETAPCVLRAKARKTFQRNGCHRQIPVIAVTLFEGTQLALRVRFLAMYLISQAKTGLSALALKRAVGVSYRTAWLLHHKLMQAMMEREAGYRLSDKVRLDDAYLGGEHSDGTVGRGAPRTRSRSWRRCKWMPTATRCRPSLPNCRVSRARRSPPGRVRRCVRALRPSRTAWPVLPALQMPGVSMSRSSWGAQAQRGPGAAVGQYGPRQCEERPEWRVSRLRLRQVRRALSGRNRLPVQSPLRPACAAGSVAGRRGGHGAPHHA